MSVSAQFEEFEPERLVKSTDRVRDLGEVYTPANIVDAMLDLLPEDMWKVHPSPTFLEPSVGNGNFVSAILSRKLTLVDQAYSAGELPAGKVIEAAEFHALEALSSIYGVDISEDNIIGGTPGHEVACRPRLLKVMQRWHARLSEAGSDSTQRSDFLESAAWIVAHNMIIGNMLATDATGKSTGRDDMPIFDFEWEPVRRSVRVSKTSLGAVLDEQAELAGGYATLFGPEPPKLLWHGVFSRLFEAESSAVIELTGTSKTNSRGTL